MSKAFCVDFGQCLKVFSNIVLALVLKPFYYKVKVPINPKFIFRLNKSFYNSEQNGANKFVFGQNRNFL